MTSMIQTPAIIYSRIGRSLFRACALGLLSVATATTVTAEPAETKGPFFTVLAVGDQSLPADLHYLATSNEGIPLTLSTVRRSKPLAPSSQISLVFGIPRQNPRPDESPFVPVCSVDWPIGVSERALVLLVTDGKTLHGTAIDDSEAIFPRGTLRVINLMKRPLVAQWGDAVMELAPGSNPARAYPSVSSPPNGHPPRFKVRLGVLADDGKGGNIIYSGRAEGRPNARTLLLVREVKETATVGSGEVLDVGVSYNTRWVVESLPKPETETNAR